MNLQMNKATVKNFRSIGNLSVDFKKGELLVICGANNIGKTNFLRALDLFFSMDKNKFNADDIPHHISEGSRGKGYKTEIVVDFTNEDTNDKYNITAMFTRKKEVGNILEIKGKKNKSDLTPDEAKTVIGNLRFMFIESNNINLPKIISEIFRNDVLPDLDKLRTKQSVPLKILENFFEESQKAVSKIETDITKHFKAFVNGVEGIKSKDWEFNIIFPNFDYLREAISSLVNFTLHDTNKRSLHTKGSGIQRMVLLSLISYISENNKGKVIWAIDEPEAFLQPSLQKKVFNQLSALAKQIDILITTHSPHFVDISNLDNTHLFEATQEPVTYTRRPDEVFIKVNTFIKACNGVEKLELIKQHMGIARNDSWNIVPYNLLVEGEEDKEYLIAMGRAFGFEIPNILVAGGVDKIPGYLEFLKEFCEDINFKPTVVALLDHDSAGQAMYKRINDNKHIYSKFNIVPKYVIRCDDKTHSTWEYEIEDFIYSPLVFEAANKILSKKEGYRKIPIGLQHGRFATSYEGTSILKYISQTVQTINRDKPPLNFEDIKLKLYLCSQVCSIISKNKLTLAEHDKDQPAVRNFLMEILKNDS